jgi:Arc/MetJ family transcription regulator
MNLYKYIEFEMKTTLDIPEELINEAMSITKATSKTALIKQALNDIIQRN